MFMDVLTYFIRWALTRCPSTAYVFTFVDISKPGYRGTELRPPENANS
jgi:hypothetical protein